MTRWLVIFIIVFSYLRVSAQPQDFLSIQKTGLNNCKLIESQFFDGRSLWGYMDGGADLYLEYGFDGLLVEQIDYRGQTLKCEIFRMTDPVSAFGIFSLQRHNCGQDTGILSFHCLNNYQVQLAKGNYYISVINSKGDSLALNASIDVIRKLGDRLKEEPVLVPSCLEDILFTGSESLIFLKGKIALGNVYPQALSYIENTASFNMWMVPSLEKDGPTASVITFQDANGLKKYLLQAFPAKTTGDTYDILLKGGKRRLARVINENTAFQVEGKLRKGYLQTIFYK